jgi:hypothetical protein
MTDGMDGMDGHTERGTWNNGWEEEEQQHHHHRHPWHDRPLFLSVLPDFTMYYSLAYSVGIQLTTHDHGGDGDGDDDGTSEGLPN